MTLWLTAPTNISIQTEDTEILYENSSTIYIKQSNITIGYVTVLFNKETNLTWFQKFTYYNDNTTTVKQHFLLEQPDLVQTIKVTGESTPLETARVCAYKTGTNPETSVVEYLMKLFIHRQPRRRKNKTITRIIL